MGNKNPSELARTMLDLSRTWENPYGDGDAGERDGTLLRECGRVGCHVISIGLSPLPAVDVAGIEHAGGNGVIGALGAVALARLPHEVLLDPGRGIS